MEVTHRPDDENRWTCEKCGYCAAGKAFNVPDNVPKSEDSEQLRENPVALQ